MKDEDVIDQDSDSLRGVWVRQGNKQQSII